VRTEGLGGVTVPGDPESTTLRYGDAGGIDWKSLSLLSLLGAGAASWWRAARVAAATCLQDMKSEFLFCQCIHLQLTSCRLPVCPTLNDTSYCTLAWLPDSTCTVCTPESDMSACIWCGAVWREPAAETALCTHTSTFSSNCTCARTGLASSNCTLHTQTHTHSQQQLHSALHTPTANSTHTHALLPATSYSYV
jgi:hypothetical protein